MRRTTAAGAAIKKLRSNKGDSIAEVLVALLISVLALTILAGMITSSKDALDRSKHKMDAYNTDNAALVSQSSTSDGTGTVTLNVTETGGTAAAWNLSGDTSTAAVNYYVNQQFASKPVVAYAEPTPAP